MTMAVDHGLHYSVEVTSRFSLFNLDEQGSPDPISAPPSQPRRDERQISQGTSKARNQASGRPAPRSGTNKAPVSGSGVAGEIALDHHKEEHTIKHKQNRHVPHRGREFDRKSGSDKTGVKSVPKKDGYGTGNWGTIDDEIEATMTEQNDALDTSNENAEEEVAEPEPETLTLEEYKAMQQGRYIASADDSGRRPNDGKDVFKDMKLLKSSKPTVEIEEPKFASVYHSINKSGIAISVSDGKRGAQRARGERRRGGGGRGGFGGDRGERPPPRRDGEDQLKKNGEQGNRGGRPSTRGAPRSGGPQSRGGAGSRGAPRGGRGGASDGRRGPQNDAPRFNDKDFPALG